MLRIYLLWTSWTHGHLSPYLCPGTWVLTSGSLQMGLKWFVNLWDTGNWSKMICQPLGHLLGPGSRVLGPGSRTQDPGPRTRYADLLLFFSWNRFHEKKVWPEVNKQQSNRKYTMYFFSWNHFHQKFRESTYVLSLKLLDRETTLKGRVLDIGLLYVLKNGQIHMYYFYNYLGKQKWLYVWTKLIMYV